MFWICAQFDLGNEQFSKKGIVGKSSVMWPGDQENKILPTASVLKGLSHQNEFGQKWYSRQEQKQKKNWWRF